NRSPRPIGRSIRNRATPGRSSARSGPLRKNGETMPKVEFHFDFGSPNAYLAHLVIPEIEQRTGAKFEYVPVLLGGVYKLTGNRSPAESLGGVKNKPDYERLETARFIKRHGITRFRQNPFFPVNTLTIMRGAIAAQKLEVFERYVDEIYRHMWSEPKKLDDPAVLRAALLESGFDAERFTELVQDGEVKAQLLDNTERSVARGTFGSPTFFVGDEIFFGKDRLRDVEEMILATRSRRPATLDAEGVQAAGRGSAVRKRQNRDCPDQRHDDRPRHLGT